jgi:hypothetical protein
MTTERQGWYFEARHGEATWWVCAECAADPDAPHDATDGAVRKPMPAEVWCTICEDEAP